MNGLKQALTIVTMMAVFALCARIATATSIQDLVRIKGQERNILQGLGLVIGLPGTGDTSKNAFVAARPFAEWLGNLGDPVLSLQELAQADAFALVNVTMEVPAIGAREGDEFDIHVDKVFNATSLKGGRLVVSFLRPPLPNSSNPPVLAFGQGMVVIEGENVCSGIVRRGGQMIADINTNPIARDGTLSLVIKPHYATFPIAAVVTNAINQRFTLIEQGDIAMATNAQTIVVRIPASDLSNPTQFLANLMLIPIDPSLIQTEARVVINEKIGAIIVTANVEIGPVAIAHNGLSITSITPPLVATHGNPQIETTPWASISTSVEGSRATTRLDVLLNALKQFNVPVKDQISIVYELKKTGALHAEIVHK